MHQSNLPSYCFLCALLCSNNVFQAIPQGALSPPSACICQLCPSRCTAIVPKSWACLDRTCPTYWAHSTQFPRHMPGRGTIYARSWCMPAFWLLWITWMARLYLCTWPRLTGHCGAYHCIGPRDTIHYHIIPQRTMGRYHTISYHNIPYHTNGPRDTSSGGIIRIDWQSAPFRARQASPVRGNSRHFSSDECYSTLHYWYHIWGMQQLEGVAIRVSGGGWFEWKA